MNLNIAPMRFRTSQSYPRVEWQLLSREAEPIVRQGGAVETNMKKIVSENSRGLRVMVMTAWPMDLLKALISNVVL